MTALEIRLLGYGVAAASLIWLFLVVKSWHDDAQQLPQVQKDFAVYKTAIETGATVRKEVSDGYEGEISKLKADRDAAGPARVVRLCSPSPVVPSAPRGTSGDPDATPGAGALPQVAGPDVGQRLYADADEADEMSAKLRACQAYARKVMDWAKRP
jgi:hypothetical protein